MLYREIIAVFSQIHTKHINTLCGQNVEFLNGKFACTKKYSLDFKWLIQACGNFHVMWLSQNDRCNGKPTSIQFLCHYNLITFL